MAPLPAYELSQLKRNDAATAEVTEINQDRADGQNCATMFGRSLPAFMRKLGTSVSVALFAAAISKTTPNMKIARSLNCNSGIATSAAKKMSRLKLTLCFPMAVENRC